MIRPIVAMLGLIICAASLSATELPQPLRDQDYRSYDPALVKLGRLLFYDRILSGSYRVSCATCHNHDRASSNGVRLDGWVDERDEAAVSGAETYEPFKPSAAHAPALFNLGARQFTRLFFDGRVARSAKGGFISSAGEDLPDGLNDVLAVQALFPAVQSDELVGTVDSDLSRAAHEGNAAIWDALAARIADTPEYWPPVRSAFPQKASLGEITMVDIANAIGAFVGTEWRSDRSAFDHYLHGDASALDAGQRRGMLAFYGEAGCSSCHAGALQTDHQRHAIGDELRRTPSLRNIAHTAPYGGDGSFMELPDYLRHHAPEIDDAQRDDLLAFLASLTDERALRGKLGKPSGVPSSLALD
ncbi:MAG: hypothetical protein OXR62_06305 [Ahrensia sp.]|nr:hypothetical protein [Ahrensia sp.]